MFASSLRLSLLFVSGCAVAPSVSTAPPSTAPLPATAVAPTPPPPPTEPVPMSSCPVGELDLPDLALGAVGVAEDGTVYVVGDVNHGNPWQLAVLDAEAGALEVLIEEQASWLEASYIEVGPDQVSLYEFYPTGSYYRFDRAEETFTLEPNLPPPGSDAFDGSFAGVNYTVQIGSNAQFTCGNVCIVALDGDSPRVVIDDADTDFYIHTGGVTFLDGWVYLNTYEPNTGIDRLRRLALDAGTVEVLHAFDADEDNGWVGSLTVVGDSVYWLRQSQGNVAIDRFDPLTGELDLDVVDGITYGVQEIELVRPGTLGWVDAEGVWTASVPGDGVAELVVGLASGDETATFIQTHGNQLWYSRRSYTSLGDIRHAVLGCIELAP